VSIETFANVSELEALELGYYYFRCLDINLLKILPNLFALLLISNEISEIIPVTLWEFNRLEYLFLEYNKMEHLESDTFCGLVNLKYIDLIGNKLQYLYPDTLVDFTTLQAFILSHNNGLQIPNYRHFINSLFKKQLDISSCNVS
jgi:Leucine-rich repeat (LRR) protein